MRKTFKTAAVHGDFITDAAYDHYGHLLATSSLDGTIKIWQKGEEEDSWLERAKIEGAGGGKIAWSHPEFGMLIAATMDNRAMIYEERAPDKWEKIWEKIVSKENICCVSFGPKHLGLLLSVCSIDGNISMFTTDATRTAWIEKETFKTLSDVSSMAWNMFPYDTPSFIIGSKSTSIAALYKLDELKRKWKIVATLDKNSAGSKGGHTKGVNHVAWAPNLGRSFHVCATAGSDGLVKIWKLSKKKNLGTNNNAMAIVDDFMEVECLDNLQHGGENNEVWKVEFNLMGTVLATSYGDDGVQLWKENFKGKWKSAAIISESE